MESTDESLIKAMRSFVVYEGQPLELNSINGIIRHLHHKRTGDKIIGFYATATLKNLTNEFYYMNVEGIREYKKGNLAMEELGKKMVMEQLRAYIFIKNELNK